MDSQNVVVCDNGTGVLVVDGYSFPHLFKRMNVAGQHITSYLVDLISRRGHAMNRNSDFEAVREIKEKLCYISYDYKREYQLGLETTILVKNHTIGLEREIQDRYLEVFLKENEDNGLQNLFWAHDRSLSFTNGSDKLVERKLRLRIEDPARRKHMVYLRGGVLAGIMKDAPEFWINRDDYLEEGLACLSKCGQA